MIYTIKTEKDVKGSCLIVNHAGIKKRHGTEVSVAKELGVDSGELYHQLARRKGMVFVIKHGNGRHWYA